MGTSLYVGNIPWDVTEDQLASVFKSTTQVDQIRAKIEHDQMTGESRGFGFVEVPEERMDHVIEAMNGYALGDRELIVN